VRTELILKGILPISQDFSVAINIIFLPNGPLLVNGRTVFHLSGISNMDKHMYLMNSTNCAKCRSVFHIVSLGQLSFLLKGILPPSGF
jgi:hypothetical protein